MNITRAERERRGRYEREVRALRLVAEQLRAAGADDEAVARDLVRRRNTLKLAFRMQDRPERVAELQRRNLAKYGDPVGPPPEWFLDRYGSWELVIDAACRPANLSEP